MLNLNLYKERGEEEQKRKKSSHYPYREDLTPNNLYQWCQLILLNNWSSQRMRAESNQATVTRTSPTQKKKKSTAYQIVAYTLSLDFLPQYQSTNSSQITALSQMFLYALLLFYSTKWLIALQWNLFYLKNTCQITTPQNV